MIPISVCIIMKNEEKNIKKCLEALTAIGFGKGKTYGEIVVTDTGSSDNSVAIAKQYTDSVYFFEWVNDFAAAKNFAIQKAKYDHVLIMDADEYVTSADIPAIWNLLQTHPRQIGRIARTNYIEENGIQGSMNDRTERLFDRRLFQFSFPIHEQVTPIHDTPVMYYDVPLSCDHSGYLLSREELAKKAERNKSLLLKELKKTPDSPYLHFQIAQSYMLIRDMENALDWFRKGLSYDIDPQMEYAQMMVIGYGECLLGTGREEEALSLTSVYEEFSFTPEFVFLMGQIYMANTMLLQAYKEFLKCLSMKPNRNPGVTSHYSFHNIGVINEMLGNKEAAITFYRKAGDYSRSVKRLEELEQL